MKNICHSNDLLSLPSLCLKQNDTAITLLMEFLRSERPGVVDGMNHTGLTGNGSSPTRTFSLLEYFHFDSLPLSSK